MISFKQFLVEGGNIKVGDTQAEPIDVAKHGRKRMTTDIHGALSEIHKSFHAATGKHLFGENEKALKTGSAYSGSTKHMFNKTIKDDDFVKHKALVGDVDVQIPKEHAADLHAHLAAGKKFGKYTLIGTKKHGNEISAVMRHRGTGAHHQVDFEATDYDKHEPTEFEQFAHSSDWHDTKAGVKGVHHKLLINATGRDKHKFSITHGLRSRTDDKEPAVKTTRGITDSLFGKAADHTHLGSFHGVTQLIKNHIPPTEHQAIYDKFKDSTVKQRGADHAAALAHLRKHLNVKDSLTESTDEVHHTTVVPITGFTPFSHMGHAKDLGETMHKLPGSKHVGISGKSEAFSSDERKEVLQRQWGKGTTAHVVTGAGETIRKAHDAMPKTGRKVLHILVGHDRKSMAEGLKKSLEAGKVKEMEGKKFDEIHIHHPEDTDRSHGMSGTKMRAAAHASNLAEFHKHLGPMFSKDEANKYMKRVKLGISTGSIPLKR